MKRKYKLHIMANDCPICGGALYKGKPCEACGFSWTAWKGGAGEATQSQPVISKAQADPDETNRKETS